jgi:hypothetical protein
MILSSEEIEVLDYLKSSPGQFIPLSEISRRAGGRRASRKGASWARAAVAHLVEEGLVESNEYARYRVREENPPEPPPVSLPGPGARGSHIVGDDYFPAPSGPHVVGDDYYPDSG